MKKSKIIAPLLILAVIIGIWFYKNAEEEKFLQEQLLIEQQLKDANFALTTTEIDLDALLEYQLPIIIDFGADECIPCQAMMPVLVTMNEKMQDKAIIKFIDVWQYPEAAANFPVQLIPTQIFINADGTPYVPSENIAIEFLMYGDTETQEHFFTAHQGGLSEEQMTEILADMGAK